MAPLLESTNGSLQGMPLQGMRAKRARARPLRGALGRAPPPVCRVEILQKFTGKSTPEKYTLFFGQKYVLRHFTYQYALKHV